MAIGQIYQAPVINFTRGVLSFQDAARKVGEAKLATAFQNAKFVYGTMGKGSEAVRILRTWAARPRRSNEQLTAAGYKMDNPIRQGIDARNAQGSGAVGKTWDLGKLDQVIKRELDLFDPGLRAHIYLSGDFQMMDMYYGDQSDIFRKRIPIIAEFIHYAMGYKSPFNPNESGRDVFKREFNTTLEGYDSRTAGGPRVRGNTATVEISKIIRWGIEHFGGMLLFEGRQVFYSQVFDRNAYHGDTDREGMSLFRYFSPGRAWVPFGKGKLAFYWNARLTIPTHCHFLSNWKWGGNDDKGRTLMHTAGKNRMEIEDYLAAAKGAMIDYSLWNRFNAVPQGLQEVPRDKIFQLLST